MRQRPAAVRAISGNLTVTADEVWAWFWLPSQRWAFRADSERVGLVEDFGTRLAGLTGRDLHWRVTHRPYPAENWAAGLQASAPAPLPGYGEHVGAAREHIRSSTMAEKETYLGVRLAARPWTSRAAGAVLRKPSGFELGKLEREAAVVEQVVAAAGFEGRPATVREVEWLLHRSMGLGLSAPGALSPAPEGGWEAEDVAEISDAYVVEAGPLDSSVKVTRRDGAERGHVAVLSVGRVPGMDIPDPGREPWLTAADKLGFEVEWSIRLRVDEPEKVAKKVRSKLQLARNTQRHYREHDMDDPQVLERQAEHAKAVEEQVVSGSPAEACRTTGWFRLAVTGSTADEVAERAREVTALFSRRQITVASPKGQYGLFREFTPGEPLSSSNYRRKLPGLHIACGVPMAATSLGDRRGPYIGHTSGQARRAVMFGPHYATEVRETSGLVPIVGQLGAGKSVLAGLITYEAVRRGVTSVMLDPSGPLARLCDLPELAAHSRHIDLTAAPAGTLNPYAVVAQPRPDQYEDASKLEEARTLAGQDRKLLALDVAHMLLPAGLAAKPETRLILTEAIRATGGAPASSLWTVVEALENRGEKAGQEIAAYLRDMAELPLARLFFPTPEIGGDDLGDKTLTVLTMPGLVLPPPNVPREHWSTSEQLAVPLLHLASWYTSRTIYGRARAERKLVALDETHYLANWSAGRALFTRLGRDSRKWNTAVLAASQNPGDVLGMEVSNFISAAFVGRIQDDEVAAEALRMIGVRPGDGYEKVLNGLSPRTGSGRSGLREFVMRDVDGNVDKMRVDLDHLPHLLEALDTTAKPDTEVAA